MGLQVRSRWFFCCGKTAAAAHCELLQFFVVAVCAGLPPDLLIALAVTTPQTN